MMISFACLEMHEIKFMNVEHCTVNVNATNIIIYSNKKNYNFRVVQV